MWRWLSRCFPGLSIILLLTLLLLAFPELTRWLPLSPGPPSTPPAKGNPEGPASLNLAQKVFIGYTILIHFNACMFVCRLSWSLSRICRETRAVLKRRLAAKNFSSPNGQTSPQFVDSPVLCPVNCSVPAERTRYLDVRSLEEGEPEEIVHAIILPNYCEDEETLRTTLNVLASHPRAPSQYEVSSSFFPFFWVINSLSILNASLLT